MIARPITEAQILYKPSKDLLAFIKKLKIQDCANIPCGVRNISNTKQKSATKKIQKNEVEDVKSVLDYPSVLEPSDIKYLNSLNLNSIEVDDKVEEISELTNKDIKPSDKLLNFDDLTWLHKYIESQNEKLAENDDKVYFHKLFQGTQIILPKNEELERNEELEARCVKLRNQQRNREYKMMTKNVDNARQHMPEETISYQMKQINTQLIAVFQFVVSVLTGFLFGFMGIELMIGTLDFGFRLLLGIICALIIALAELYFLAKKLNEEIDSSYESTNITSHHQNSKVKSE